MRAIAIQDGRLVEEIRPDPVAGPGEVVVEVAAAGVNRADLLQRAGNYPPPPGASDVPGLEVSGRVIALGAGVEGVRVGDRVCALLAGGGYAERVAVPATQLLPVPESMDLVDAAGLPEAVCTVWSNVFLTGRLERGELLLIHGGSSGIGTIGIQLARALGSRVAVTAGSAEKLALCAELGAEILIDYHDQDFVAVVRDAGGADVILDVMGAVYLDRNVQALALDGRLSIIGMQGGSRGELDIGALMARRGTVFAQGLRGRSRDDKAGIVGDVRERAWPLVEAGSVRPLISARFPLAEADAAVASLDDRGHRGKVLLIP
ncbi:NAD(P)H-quinone oxidoreductase [uncultured Microbacterium sp.]|uniref:NAD(P)H-quinone oxidoreductase n=1 Tax=uncultured Microbacterium sp. TaxID=191216 RepID=UPI0025E53AC7|nr:NAD(P)H-quinone oxidoreductase [uncultured Microbacterium sp.]